MGLIDGVDRDGEVRVGPDVDPGTGARVGPGLQVAVPSRLRAGRARAGDLDVVLYAGDPATAPTGWQRIGTVDPTLSVWIRP
jgi:hypothetical protein